MIDLSGKLILIVEDSEDNQFLISHYLRAARAEVEIASNGVIGLQKARVTQYDLIVMDIQMPGLDGHAVTRTLRQEGFAMPVIALTAHAVSDERQKAIESGFDHYLTKPIDRSAFIQAVGKCLKLL